MPNYAKNACHAIGAGVLGRVNRSGSLYSVNDLGKQLDIVV